ncbi:MAG: DUF262 domain-containing protein [Planctomycetota bacterium]
MHESASPNTKAWAYLSPRGFSVLESYLQRALNLKRRFEEEVEQGASVADASRRWREGWEEDLTAEDNRPVQVNAQVAAWRIKDFRDNAQEGRLDLNPSYQRDVVWSNSDSQKLIESVLRGIPLPSVILNQRMDSQQFEIVDGKQRLTAILRFIGEHPAGVRYAKEQSTADVPLDAFQNNYRKWRRVHGLSAKEERRLYLPFSLARFDDGDPLAPLSGRFFSEIQDKKVLIQGKEHTVRDLFLSAASKYLLPIILYEETDLRQIHRVFGLYNKQGKHLNAEELRNAIYHHLELTRLLLALSGDGAEASSVSGVARKFRTSPVRRVLTTMNVQDARFHMTKLASWVTALMVQDPRKGDGSVATPSTAGFINKMLDRIDARPGHPLRSESGLSSLASMLSQGAELMEVLCLEEAFPSGYQNTSKSTEKWADLPVVATWLACTLAVLAGIKPSSGHQLADDVIERVGSVRPPDKQQSRSQWCYIAKASLVLLDALGVDLEALEAKLSATFDFDCIPALQAIRQLGA